MEKTITIIGVVLYILFELSTACASECSEIRTEPVENELSFPDQRRAIIAAAKVCKSLGYNHVGLGEIENNKLYYKCLEGKGPYKLSDL